MKLIYSICHFIFITGYTFAQTLKVDEVDEFTGDTVKITTWECFQMDFSFTGYFRVSSIDGDLFLHVKLMLANGDVFSIDKGKSFFFKFENDEVIEVYNSEFSITCPGCGAVGIAGSKAEGISTSYSINRDDAMKLVESPVSRFRIITNDGYLENDMKPKRYKKIKNAFQLVLY